MNELISAAHQALVALESYSKSPYIRHQHPKRFASGVEAITALRAALAEPVQPVAWATEIIDALQAQYDTEMIKENDSGDALIRLDSAIAAVAEHAMYEQALPPP